MLMKGMWFDPARAGEGFNFAEEGDETYGYYYTYQGGQPTWFMLHLRQGGGLLNGTVTRVSGGAFANPGSPGKVTEEEVGGCQIALNTDGTRTVRLAISSTEVRCTIRPLFGAGAIVTPPSEPPPVEPPPEDPPNPFEGKLTFRVKGFKKTQFYPGEFWLENGQWFLIWSTAQIIFDNLRAGTNTMLELEITAQEDISILHTSGASSNPPGYGNPTIERPTEIKAGETKVLVFKLTKGSRPTPTVDINYQINTNLGTAVLYTVHLMGGQ